MRSHLDKVLEMNQVDSVIEDPEDDNRESYDTIENYLIKCVSVICHAIKNDNPRVKNVIIRNFITKE